MNNYITQGTTITVQTAVLKIKIAEYPKIFPKNYIWHGIRNSKTVLEDKNIKYPKIFQDKPTLARYSQ